MNPTDLCRAANLPILAMAQHDLGDEALARQTLESSAQLLKKLETDNANKGHNDFLIAKILHREAEKKIDNDGK
jgi:hypothetical protein